MHHAQPYTFWQRFPAGAKPEYVTNNGAWIYWPR